MQSSWISKTLKTADDVAQFNTIERKAILSARNDPMYRNMFEFAFWTVLRTSEIVATTWEDIDWLRSNARYRKQGCGDVQCHKTL
jgi:integrase